MESSLPHHQRKSGFITTCAHCHTSFNSYHRNKKTCSVRCRKKARERIKQLAASAKLTADIMGLYQAYRSEQQVQSSKIIY
jgi:hypothetical protein